MKKGESASSVKAEVESGIELHVNVPPPRHHHGGVGADVEAEDMDPESPSLMSYMPMDLLEDDSHDAAAAAGALDGSDQGKSCSDDGGDAEEVPGLGSVPVSLGFDRGDLDGLSGRGRMLGAGYDEDGRKLHMPRRADAGAAEGGAAAAAASLALDLPGVGGLMVSGSEDFPQRLGRAGGAGAGRGLGLAVAAEQGEGWGLLGKRHADMIADAAADAGAGGGGEGSGWGDAGGAFGLQERIWSSFGLQSCSNLRRAKGEHQQQQQQVQEQQFQAPMGWEVPVEEGRFCIRCKGSAEKLRHEIKDLKLTQRALEAELVWAMEGKIKAEQAVAELGHARNDSPLQHKRQGQEAWQREQVLGEKEQQRLAELERYVERISAQFQGLLGSYNSVASQLQQAHAETSQLRADALQLRAANMELLRRGQARDASPTMPAMPGMPGLQGMPGVPVVTAPLPHSPLVGTAAALAAQGRSLLRSSLRMHLFLFLTTVSIVGGCFSSLVCVPLC
ncbi:unnamed protein product [Closterium sp. Yama58-4]|nr:unnamed protein product [Closterium sp. Yama58-4]